MIVPSVMSKRAVGTPITRKIRSLRFQGSLTTARGNRMQKLFHNGKPPLLWCPVLAHYDTDGTLDAQRMHAHQSWLFKNGVKGFLVPGSTGDAWDMSMNEKMTFLRMCREIALSIREQHGESPHLLGGALEATEEDTAAIMTMMHAEAENDILGFCVCPPRGISEEGLMETALSGFLEKFPNKAFAVYQLPQVTEVTMPVALLRRLADKHDNYLLFKDSSGKDAMALSGVTLDGVFMVRGAEGNYAEWLANPITSGYHGFLLSTANVYPEQLTSLINKVALGADGGDLVGAASLSSRITSVTNTAFDVVTGELAKDLGGNAFTNSAKAVDFWMAFGPYALEHQRPLPLLKSGQRLPQTVLEKVGDALHEAGLMPVDGYAKHFLQKPTIRVSSNELLNNVSQPTFDPRATRITNEGAYKVLAKAQALERGDGPWSARNKGVIHFEIGQPDYPTPQHIKDAAAQAIADGKTTYVNPSGLPELRESLARHVKRTRGVTVSPDEVFVGPGCKPGLYFVAQALLGAGDELLFPDPGFPQYNALATINGATPVPIPLDDDNSAFQWDKFDEAINSGKAKALIICSPSNPTGGVMAAADVERVARACDRAGVWLISDEIYSALTYDYNRPFVSPISVPGVNRDRLVLLDGFSKSYCMTGFRLGWAVMPDELLELVTLLTVHAIGCSAAFTQWAGVAAIEGSQICIQEMLNEYRNRRDFVVRELNSMPGVRCNTPTGAFYAFPNVSMWGLPSQQIADMLLNEAGVATLPGTDFGRSAEGFIRISYVCDMDTLKAGMERMRTFFKDMENGKYASVMPIAPDLLELGFQLHSADC